MDIKSRDKRLAAIFSKKLLSQLDEAEKNVLSEEFSNSEMKLLADQDIEVIHNRLTNYLAAEHERRLTQIQPEEYELLKDWYLSNAVTLDEIICSKCGVLLGIEIDTIDDNMNPHHHEGKFVVPIGQVLMSYRPRTDGVMGYQCGNIVETEYKQEWDEYPNKLAKAQEKYEDEMAKYTLAVEKFEALSEKKKEKTEFPTAPEPEIIGEPEGPAYVECNNDTRWGQIEIDNIPEDHVMTSITKEDRIKVKQQMDATNYIPDVTETDSGKTVETFELRKVK